MPISISELLGGGQQKPTAQEMAGGIPQNADPGKGKRPVLGDYAPPPVQTAAAPPMEPPAPAQLMPQETPMAPAATPPAAPMQADPMMQQALAQRLQQQQQQQQPQQGGMFMDEGLPSWLQKAYSAIPSPIGFAATGNPWASSRDIYNTLHPGGR